ncbi:Hypothetical predicted protein [Paramuricea clavata]|uniref:Uncharacterized protein n=1 Tax=Paramuricea clavata TaxID=317549 RepID=A0A6S7HAP1_PARCT|nr:Hypothetical predicted protein [Paramuricea clavata]
MEKADISTRIRGKVAEVLVEEAMSSEESCVGEAESGKTKIVGYKIKRLSWVSGKLRKVKAFLDKTMREGQTQRARDRALPRTDHEVESSTLPPKDFPDWAIQSSE